MNIPDLVYYTVENTGFSNGNSWFDSYCTYSSGNLRFDTYEEAYKLAYTRAEESRKSHEEWMLDWTPHPDEPNELPPEPTKHRVVSHRISRTENSITHHEKWDIV